MRILLVSQQYRNVRTGPGTYARSLAGGLEALGHELTLAVPRTEAPEDDRFETIPLDFRPGNFTPRRLLALGLALRRGLPADLSRYDVVHFLDARESASLALAGRPRGPVLVGSVLDSYALDWLAPTYPRKRYDDRLLRGVYYAWLRRVERFAYHRLDRLLANSEHPAKQVAQSYAVGRERIRVVRRGLPLRDPPKPERLDGDPSILFVGANYRRKGLDVLLEAFARLARRAPDARLHVVGDDPAARRFENRARELDLASRVLFHGPRPNEHVLAMMAGATVFALPSFVEAFGVVYLEALRVGTPVVATRHGGLAEWLEHGRDAWFVPPDDVDALADALRLLAHNPTLRRELAENGRKRSLDATAERAAEETLSAYSTA